MDPEYTEMTERYEQLYHIMLIEDELPDFPINQEKDMERHLLYLQLRVKWVPVKEQEGKEN